MGNVAGNIFVVTCTSLPFDAVDNLGSLGQYHAIRESNEVPDEISGLLEEFDEVFKEPSSLPPMRSHDHSISLKPKAEPVNIRPYRYPHF